MSAAVGSALDRLVEAVEELRAAAVGAGDDELMAVLQACSAGKRRLDHVAVETLSTVQRRGVFVERGYRSATAAVTDLLRCERGEARRFAVVAEQVAERIGLDGAVLPPRLPATATVLGSGEIGLRHAEMIADVLGTGAAERLDPDTWAAVEVQLADAATRYSPAELHTFGTQMVEALDQDGPEPDDDRPEPQVNELRIARHRNRPGGTIKGRFDDAAQFEAIATAVDAHSAPRDADEARTPARRQAEALSEICGYALEHAPAQVVPETGGRRPTVTVLVRLEDLENRARAAMLDFGGQVSAESLRMLACDAGVVPVVMNGASQPLDVGRIKRTIPDGLRRAVAARDRGCAHPGCGRPPSWCEVHHIDPWECGGGTCLENCVMLCKIHHVRHEALSVPNGGERTPSAIHRSESSKLRAA